MVAWGEPTSDSEAGVTPGIRSERTLSPAAIWRLRRQIAAGECIRGATSTWGCGCSLEARNPHPRLSADVAPRLPNVAMPSLFGAYKQRRHVPITSRKTPLSRTLSLPRLTLRGLQERLCRFSRSCGVRYLPDLTIDRRGATRIALRGPVCRFHSKKLLSFFACALECRRKRWTSRMNPKGNRTLFVMSPRSVWSH